METLPSSQNETAFTRIDLDDGKTLDEIEADRQTAEVAERAEARRTYEEERNRVQRQTERDYENGQRVTGAFIVPVDDGSYSLDGSHTSSHVERNHMDIVYEGIANANYPRDDTNLRPN